jgi:ABC-2 type transport system ATP-binding protein
MTQPTTRPAAEPPAAAAAARAALAARGISKRFGPRWALRDVSLAIAPSELVAIIGPNGAGKTTLLSILAGETRADAGTVSLSAREIGWVPQQPALYGRLTVAENLRLFARLERAEDVDAAVTRMLAETGLEQRARDRVETLSGGNRQRVNVAIGLLSSPRVLLLDEPSTALDPAQRARLWDFLGGLVARGTAIVYSTHNVQEAEGHADRVVVLADGERVFDGAPRALEAETGANGGFEAAFIHLLRRSGR